MTRTHIKRWAAIALRLLNFAFILYLCSLGLPRFEEMHPEVYRIFKTAAGIVGWIVFLGIVLYHAVLCVRAFREGMVESRRGQSAPK